MEDTFDAVVSATTRSWREAFPEHDAAPILLFMRLGYLSRRLQQFHDAVLRPHGRTLTEYQVLATLRMNGAQTPSGLNGLLMLTRAGMTNTLDRLERAGLVRRRADAADGRSVRIQLTARGTRHAEKLLLAEQAAQHDLLSDIGRGERRGLERAVATLIGAFDASRAEPDRARTHRRNG